MKNKVVAVAGCKHTTRDLIEGLVRLGYEIRFCLTLDRDLADRNKVAGYMDLSDFLKSKGIKRIGASSYSLNNESDQESLSSLGIDLLLVMGWQRLIPAWLLDRLSIGAFGMHGSSKRLPYGRGRSPMNWSLIQNKTQFFTHLFRYDPGIDSGDVVGIQTFDITPWDDCHTLHLKNTLSMIKLCEKVLPELLEGKAKAYSQDESGECYYPKRTAQDGLIFWEDGTLDIFNLVRAVTKPFPGAFTYLDDDPGKRITIWKAIPFDSRLRWDKAETGEIVEMFYDGSFVAKTGDTTLLVQEYESDFAIGIGDLGKKLGTAGEPRKIWKDLPL